MHQHDLFRNINPSIALLNSIYVGKGSEYDIENGPYKSWYKHAHTEQMTDFNMWKRVLTIDEGIQWSNCRLI